MQTEPVKCQVSKRMQTEYSASRSKHGVTSVVISMNMGNPDAPQIFYNFSMLLMVLIGQLTYAFATRILFPDKKCSSRQH
jgi:hypothetical protein